MSPPGRLSKLWKKRARPDPDGGARPSGRYAFETLEPRILLSADPVTGALAEEAAPPPPDPGAPSTEDVAELAALLEPEAAAHEPAVELVFVDASTQDTQQLLDDLRTGRDGRQFEVVVIDENEDGLALISETLAGRSDVDAVHVVSHATEGSVRLGSSWLGQDQLAANAELVQGWQASLSADADLLFYGCDLAGNAEGRGLVQELARLTGADVAASEDLTGAAELGGDWDLEVTSGVIETAVAFSVEAQQGWQAVLATATFQQGVDGYTGTEDTFLNEDDADTGKGSQDRVEIEWAPSWKHGLLQFDNLFGLGPGQIPYGSTITSATLTVEVENGSTPSSAVSLHRMLTGWSEFSATWNSMGAGIQTDDVEAMATPDAILTPANTEGTLQFTGLATAVQSWSDGAANHGWHLAIDVGNDWRISSSENSTTSERPLLTVDYTPPAELTQNPALWAGTTNDVGASGAAELPSWTDGQILQLEDPGLGFGSPTDGTWSSPANLDPFSVGGADFGSLHYVSTNLSLGGGVGPSIQLISGDLLLSTEGPEGFPGVVADGSDILLFRPDTPGDYSSGSFVELLDNPLGGDIYAFSLVEENTTVGGTLLPKGSFIASQGGSASVVAFTVDGVTTNTAIRDLGGGAGSATLLLDGPDFGVGADFDGLELIEQNVTLGGVMLQAGDIIATLDGNDPSVGSGVPISTLRTDAFVVRATSTGPTSVATASMFLEGAGVHLDSPAEGLDGLALGTVFDPTPSLAMSGTPVYNEGDPAIVIDGTALLSDIGSPDFAGGSLTVDFSGGGTPEDRLAIRDQGAGFGNISLSGSAVRFDFGVGPVVIGTFSGGVGAGDPLIVSLNASSTKAAVQALIRNVTYENVAIVPSEANRDVQFVVDDGDVGPSAPATVTIDFEIDHSLWLNAAADTNPSDTNLSQWLAGDIVEIGPGATFGENTTTGDFGRAFSMFLNDASDADLQALHYVSSYVDLGSGGNSFQLRPGDVMATIDGAFTVTLQSTNTLDVTDNDLFVFRPDTPGDYSSGTFSMLLKDPVGKNIHAITLVERDVVLPDKTISAGSFLLAHSTPGEHDDVYLFEATDVGPILTSGSKNMLLSGAVLGTSDQVRGLELIEEATTVGDATLTAGQLLVSFNNTATIAGQLTQPQDILMLDILATEFGAGTSVSASILMDGDDVNLADPSEKVDGLSLAPSSPINIGPTATIGAASYAISENTSFILHGTGMSVSDPDAGGAPVRVGLSVGEGTLSVSAGGTGVLVTNPLSSAVTLDGTLAQINALLSGASGATIFYDALDAPSASTLLTLGIDDLGNSGFGGALTGDDAATLSITAENDAPTLGNGALGAVDEDTAGPAGQTVATIFSGQFTDPDAVSSFKGIAVVGNTANPVSEGRWQYSTNAGMDWSDIGAVGDDATALALDSATLIRFLPASNFAGVPTGLSVRGLDDTYVGYSTTGASETRETVDTSLAGGGSAIATATASLDTSITPVGDTPVAASISTLEDIQSGLILLDKNANDGAEVTHLWISGITNGSLFLADGTTPVLGGSYITLAQGQAGLRFTPDPGTNLPGSFDVESSENGTSVAAQSGQAASTITITPVGDTPVAASITTDEDTQSGLILLDKNANDGAEVTHLRISGITNGSLFLADGTTPVAEGAYITLAQGQAGLRFTPDPGTNLAGNFLVESSENGTSVAAQSGQAMSTITVTPVGDTPAAANITTDEDTQSGLILLDKNANDGAEVTHLRISGITNGSLFLADGTTPVAEGAYITLAQGQAGLRFTPNPGTNLPGSFDVESSENGTSVAAQSGQGASTITVNPVGDTPVAASIGTLQDTLSAAIALDKNANDGAEVTHLRISGITNGSLFQNDGVTPILDGDYITLAQGQAGVRFLPSLGTVLPGSFQVESSEDGLTVAAQSGQATSTISVTGTADTPSVTNSSTLEDSQTTAGLVISRSPLDGTEVTHFKITGISGGTLFQNDGVTPISNGEFISFAQGNAGLRFTPTANSNASGSFDVQASTMASDPGLGGGAVTATISVTPVGDTPQAADITTDEDTQSGLILLDRHASDGAEVTHLRISGIANGSLFLADGTTPVADGAYITLAQGQAGLRFTPDPETNLPGSFRVESSENGTSVAAQSGQAVSAITINPVGDTPVAASISTSEDVQSGLIVLDKNPSDGAEITHLRISGITGGSLFLADGTTPVADGAYITLAQGQAGLRLTPSLDSTAAGSFQVESSQDGASVSAQSGQAASTITVTPVNDPPSASISPGSYAVDGGVPLSLEGTGLSVGDVDAGGAPVRATLSVGEGSLAVAPGATGVAVGGSPTIVTLDGTLSQINALLSGGTGATITYAPPASPSGTGTLTLAIDDLGASGAGVPLTDSDVATFTVPPPVTAPPPVDPPIDPPTLEPPPVLDTGEGDTETEPDTGSEETPTSEEDDEADTLVAGAGESPVPEVSAAGPDLVATLDVVERALRSLRSGQELAPLELGSSNPREAHGAGEPDTGAVAQLRGLLLQLIPAEEIEHRVDGLIHELDELRDELKNQSDVERLVVGSITGSASALSIGYVVWLLRGGMLLSSVLSSLPAWQLIDPLPVLGHLTGPDDDEEEDESLEEIARRKTKPSAPDEAQERVE